MIVIRRRLLPLSGERDGCDTTAVFVFVFVFSWADGSSVCFECKASEMTCLMRATRTVWCANERANLIPGQWRITGRAKQRM